MDVAWRSAIPTDAVTKDALTVFVKFDSGEWQIEEWNTSPPHDKRLYVPYGAEASYISDFIQHELFRLEIENSDGVILWNEWEMSGLADWIDQPWELCELSGTGSPSTHLYNPIFPSEHMAYIWWEWKPDQTYFREMVTEFTIHNDVGDFSDRHGLHLILGQSSISDVRFYFGVQTDATRRGKGLIFSRWKTRDLANARYSEEDGWTESSGHGEDFIGVRRSYDWSAGNYRVRIAPDGLTSDGEWFGLWITDLDAGQTTWIGSLKFPLQEAEARIKPTSYSGIEIYGVAQIRPIDIPQWQVSVKRPQGDNVASIRGYTGYSAFKGDALQNSDVRYDPSEDIVHLRAGGVTKRETAAGYVAFE